ncbi:MAG: hypothetical protein KDA87_23055 [Planctomycetales bacterium]|nr:hypothetical protein [Planctomycetales bacterium]
MRLKEFIVGTMIVSFCCSIVSVAVAVPTEEDCTWQYAIDERCVAALGEELDQCQTKNCGGVGLDCGGDFKDFPNPFPVMAESDGVETGWKLKLNTSFEYVCWQNYTCRKDFVFPPNRCLAYAGDDWDGTKKCQLGGPPGGGAGNCYYCSMEPGTVKRFTSAEIEQCD